MSTKKTMSYFAMSRRRKAAIIIFCIVSGIIFATVDHRFDRLSKRRRPQNDEETKVFDLEKYDGRTFVVVNVVDGDTIDIDVPDGEFERTRIRLWGVDAPETKSDEFGVMHFGPQATDLTGELTLGKKVCIYLDKNKTRDKYERLLAYVQLPDIRFLNEVLISDGFAYADLRFKHNSYHNYKRLESVARSAKKGLWQDVKRKQWPSWRQRMVK